MCKAIEALEPASTCMCAITAKNDNQLLSTMTAATQQLVSILIKCSSVFDG